VDIIRAIGEILRSGTVNWPTTLRLCALLIAGAVAGAVFLILYTVVSAVITSAGAG
jgi:hypothetical protein